MNDKDILQRFIFENASVRGEIIRLEESYQTIMHQHKYPPVIRNILGEMLVVVSLLSASVKFRGRISVQFQGKGSLKLLLAQSNQELEIRGLAQWQGELTAEEMMSQLKMGTLVITMDSEVAGGNRYQGIVSWEGDSFASSIEGYFRNSEQVPTRLWIAINDKHAAGLLIQVMPNEKERLGQSMEDEDWDRLSYLSSTITSDELLQLDNDMILHRLYNQEDVRLFAARPVSFRCTCSIKRGENALRLLGIEEVEEELRDKQTIVVTCEFCNKEFVFTRDDVTRVFGNGSSAND